MTSYAALVSLLNILEQIQNHPRRSTAFNRYQIESLAQNVNFLLHFLESSNDSQWSTTPQDLKSQIVSAAYAAEDVIEYSAIEKSPNLSIDLQWIIEEMDSVKEKVIKFKEERGIQHQQLTYSMPAPSSRLPTYGNTTMLGFDGYLIQLLEWLVGEQPDRKIIPIVGMGGIGKTTLARNLYENLLIVQHFDVRAWVTISQEYNVREILLEILSCVQQTTRGLDERTEDELGEHLYKILFGRRYLVMLDDIWSITAWDKIKFFFPENHERSRIVVTTRLSDMADHFCCFKLALDFLNDHDSWDLFCEKAFTEERCPLELKEIGKEIVKKCRGLPLSIVVIGGLLRNSSRTQEYWENVAEDISSVLNSAEDDEWLNVLSLSYNHLPVCLKPCFLYLGIFPEDHLIRVSRLIKLWISEGLLKPDKNRSLEEVAKDHVKDLADRNLLLVHHLGSNGKIKTCKIHDLLRELCRKMGEKEKFFCVTRVFNDARDLDREGRLVFCESMDINLECHPRAYRSQASTSLAFALVRQGDFLFRTRLLRVMYETSDDSLDPILQQYNVRFLAYEYSNRRGPPWWSKTYKFSSSIFLLWNGQTIIVKGGISKVIAPIEIWQMPQLRHLEFHLIHLPDPPQTDKLDNHLVLRNLHTLQMVQDFKCCDEVCKRLLNIRKLHILYDSDTGLHSLGGLHKLESLKCHFTVPPDRYDLLNNLSFPGSLKKLSLQNCRFHGNDLTMIGSLPHLEVLKLGHNSIVGHEWSPRAGQFLRLKFLKIFSCQRLIHWNAESSHFPVLETLAVQRLYELDEIPSGIGEIATLQSISVEECSSNAGISAIKILEEQESFGNEGLQVRVGVWDNKGYEEFKKLVDLEGFTCHNFQIYNSRKTHTI